MTTAPTVSYAQPSERLPWYRRVNYRVIVFLLVASAPFLFIIGLAVRNASNGGIVDRGDYLEVNLQQLGNFTFDDMVGTLNEVPSTARALDGKRVKLQGFAYQPLSAGPTGKEFQFVYDVNKCCFNGPPLVQERVFAFSEKEIPIPSSAQFCELVGTMRVRLTRADGADSKIVRVFDLDVESLKPVQ